MLTCVCACGAFFMFCPVRCLIVVFSGSYLALWSPYWAKGSWLLCFYLVCGFCIVCSGLLVLPLGVNFRLCPVSILHKSIAGRYRPVSIADGPITTRCRFIKNANLGGLWLWLFLAIFCTVMCKL